MTKPHACIKVALIITVLINKLLYTLFGPEQNSSKCKKWPKVCYSK